MVFSLLAILLLSIAGWVLSRSTALGRQLGMTMVVLLLGLLVTLVFNSFILRSAKLLYLPARLARGFL